MRKTQEQEKGITLIALVLTIIVLMILAAVSVATLTGDNGILTKAQEAKETAKKAEIEEQLRLAELSAKIKREGGAITVSDLLQELENQGVDFERGEGGNNIVIDGKYVIDIQEENGELKFEDQGTVSKPKPKVVSIDIIEITKTTIEVKVSTLRNEGGTLKYYIQKENAEDYELVKEQEEEKYIFEKLDPDTTYSKIKVEAKAPNGETAYLEIEISNVPSLAEEEAVTLSYRTSSGQVIREEDWTKEPVTVTVKVNSNINTKGYTLQTAKSTGIERTGEITWQDSASQSFTTNGVLYARLIDKTNGKEGKEYTKKITTIDTLAPKDFTPEITDDNIKTNSITVTGMTEDAMEAGETEGSGIDKYYFSIDEGNGKPENWQPTWIPEGGQMAVKGTQASYQLEGLKQDTTYRIKMKAIDKVGRETVSEEITKTTGTVRGLQQADLNLTYEAEAWGEEGWTNKDVTVTVEPNIDIAEYELQTSQDGTNWDTKSSQTFTGKGVLYARLYDGTNWGGMAQANVDKIDKDPPTLEITGVSYDDVELYDSDNVVKNRYHYFSGIHEATLAGDCFWGSNGPQGGADGTDPETRGSHWLFQH